MTGVEQRAKFACHPQGNTLCKRQIEQKRVPIPLKLKKTNNKITTTMCYLHLLNQGQSLVEKGTNNFGKLKS